MIPKLRRSYFLFFVFQSFSFSLENDMLTSTYFAIFFMSALAEMSAPLKR